MGYSHIGADFLSLEKDCLEHDGKPSDRIKLTIKIIDMNENLEVVEESDGLGGYVYVIKENIEGTQKEVTYEPLDITEMYNRLTEKENNEEK